MMLNNYNEVAALKKPVYSEDGKEEISFVDPPMISLEELDRFLNTESGGKNLKWINSWQPIEDNFWSNQPLTDEVGNKPSGGQRTYKGMWRIQGMKEQTNTKESLNEHCTWEGIGII